MTSLTSLLIVILVSVVVADHLHCHPGLVDFYKYESTISGLGKGKEELEVRALISITCEKMVRMNGVDTMIMLMETTNVQISHKGTHPVQVPYDKDYEKPLTFLQTRNGDILRIIHEKNEKPSVISIKKSMLSNFVIKMAGHTGIEMTQAGKVKFQYEKAETKDAKAVIKKTAVEVLEPADKNQKLKDAKFNQITYIQINPDGKPHRIYTKTGSKIGEPSKRRHDLYAREKVKINVEEHPNDFKSTPGAANAFNFGSESTMQLVRTGHLHGEGSNLRVDIDEPKDSPQTLAISEFEESLEDDQHSQTMAMDPALIVEAREHRKHFLHNTVDFPSLLQKVKENPLDHNTLADAHDYVSTLGDEALEHVVSEYIKLSLDKEHEAIYGHALLSMFTVAQTEKGQNELIKTMNHHVTVQQAVLNSLAIKNPSEKLVESLKTLSSKKIDGLSEDDSSVLNTNAYLAYAHTASKISVDKGHEILSGIIENLGKAENIQQFENSVHALANAGSIVPVSVLGMVATNEMVPLEVRSAAIIGLGHRIGEEDSEEVTNMLFHLTEKHYHEHIRTAAVSALTAREAEMQDGIAVNYLKQYLEDPTTPVTLVHAIKEYNLEVGTDESHGILDSTKLGEKGHIGDRGEAVKVMAHEGYFDSRVGNHDGSVTLETNVMFFRRLRRAFRRLGGHIRRAASRIGRAIVKVAKKVGKAVVDAAKAIGSVVGKVKNFMRDLKAKFSKAQFKGEKVCITSSSKGDRICLYDEDMVAFVRKQGDLSMMRYSKQFAFETLIGVEIMHAYIGMVGYAGTRIDCETNSFDLVVFGRAEAKARLFNRRVPIIGAEIELQKRTGQDLVDRAYLRVFKAVVFDNQFVPEKIRKFINSCEKNSKPLMKPVNKPLINFSFTMVVVVVPITFSISVTGKLSLDLVTIICPGRLTLTASIEPTIGIGISASAGIGFAIVSGGVKATFSASYTLKPGFGTSNCNLCAVLDHEVRPVNIRIDLYLKALVKTWNVKLYEFNGKVIRGNLFKYCLFKNKPYDPESVLNGPPPEPPQSAPDTQPISSGAENQPEQAPTQPQPEQSAPGEQPAAQEPQGEQQAPQQEQQQPQMSSKQQQMLDDHALMKRQAEADREHGKALHQRFNQQREDFYKRQKENHKPRQFKPAQRFQFNYNYPKKSLPRPSRPIQMPMRHFQRPITAPRPLPPHLRPQYIAQIRAGTPRSMYQTFYANQQQ